MQINREVLSVAFEIAQPRVARCSSTLRSAATEDGQPWAERFHPFRIKSRGKCPNSRPNAEALGYSQVSGTEGRPDLRKAPGLPRRFTRERFMLANSVGAVEALV